ncbi:MAG: metal-dependent transcriptional regulator [Lacibacter sp.]
MVLSEAEENYIKAIWRLQKGKEAVSTNALAEALHTKPASVTDMLKRLKQKKLLHYKPYYGVQLAPEGRMLALGIVRRHRLWEYFLAEKLGFEWDAVHEIAEQLEHVSSAELIERLDAYLGHPRTDPHGDPIPDRTGHMETTERFCLNDLQVQQPATVTAVGDQSSSLLELLRQKNIGIGTRLSITRRFAYDGSLELHIHRKPVTTISEQLARNIFVRIE